MQRHLGRGGAVRLAWTIVRVDTPYDGRFTFVRLCWRSDFFRRGGFGAAWNHDYPRAERHLSLILRELTTLDVRTDSSLVLTLGDPELFNYPIAFMQRNDVMLRIFALAVVAVWVCTGSRAAAEMTDLDRQRLLAHMEMTAGWLADEISGLSAAQFLFRPAAGQWSVAEVLEHLVVVAPIYRADLQAALRQPPRKPSAMADADVLWYGIDRTRKEQATPTERPSGQLRDLRAALAAYREHHNRLLEFLKTTRDDLRSHIVERQGCDAYQWALLISTHEQRHVLQIREIKAHPQFPQNGKAQRD